MIKKEKAQEVTLAAIIGSVLSLIIYFIGFHDTKKQAFYEHKLTAMEKYVKDASTRIYYMRFMDWIHLEITKAQVQGLPRPDTINPFKAVELYGSQNYNGKYISDFKNDLIKTRLSKDTIRYKGFEYANESFSQYEASYLTTQNFFDDETIVQMKKLDSLLSPSYYQNVVNQQIGTSGIKNIINGTIDNILLDKRRNQLDVVAEAMKKEINKEK